VLAVGFIVEIDSMMYTAMQKGLFGIKLKKVVNETKLTVDVTADSSKILEKGDSQCWIFFMVIFITVMLHVNFGPVVSLNGYWQCGNLDNTEDEDVVINLFLKNAKMEKLNVTFK